MHALDVYTLDVYTLDVCTPSTCVHPRSSYPRCARPGSACPRFCVRPAGSKDQFAERGSDCRPGGAGRGGAAGGWPGAAGPGAPPRGSAPELPGRGQRCACVTEVPLVPRALSQLRSFLPRLLVLRLGAEGAEESPSPFLWPLKLFTPLKAITCQPSPRILRCA